MFAVSIYMMFMGNFYDNKLLSKLPAGATLAEYNADGATPEMKSALAAARTAAGPEIINATLLIPVVLIVAFIGLYIYMRNRPKVTIAS